MLTHMAVACRDEVQRDLPGDGVNREGGLRSASAPYSLQITRPRKSGNDQSPQDMVRLTREADCERSRAWAEEQLRRLDAAS